MQQVGEHWGPFPKLVSPWKAKLGSFKLRVHINDGTWIEESSALNRGKGPGVQTFIDWSQEGQKSSVSPSLKFKLTWWCSVCCCCWVASVVSDSVRPHRQQPTRLPRPWDSPGKNTGVGCQFLLQCMNVKSESEVAQSCLTLRDPMDGSLPGSSVHGIFQERVLECLRGV